MRVGVYEQDAIQLKKNIHVLRGSAKERLQWLREQMKATEEVLKIANNLDKFAVEFDAVNTKAKGALSGEHFPAADSLASTAASLISASASHFSTPTSISPAASLPIQSPVSTFNFCSDLSTGSINGNLFNDSPSSARIEDNCVPRDKKRCFNN